MMGQFVEAPQFSNNSYLPHTYEKKVLIVKVEW
jgi:hypothetical protein